MNTIKWLVLLGIGGIVVFLPACYVGAGWIGARQYDRIENELRANLVEGISVQDAQQELAVRGIQFASGMRGDQRPGGPNFNFVPARYAGAIVARPKPRFALLRFDPFVLIFFDEQSQVQAVEFHREPRTVV